MLQNCSVVAAHAFGPHYLSRLVLPGMRTLGGDIIMISVSQPVLWESWSAYNMGETAMEALAYTLAKEEK